MARKFLGNSYDYRRTDAKQNHIYTSSSPEKREIEWQQHLKWATSKYLGPPQATEKHSTEELAGMGLIGLYVEE